MAPAYDAMVYDREEAEFPAGGAAETAGVCVSAPMNRASAGESRQFLSMSHHRSSSPSISAQTTKSTKSSKHRRPQLNVSAHKFGLFLLICLCAFDCSAYLIQLTGHSSLDEQMIEPPTEDTGLDSPAPYAKILPDDELLESTLARLAKTGTILVDLSPPPVPVSPGSWELYSLEEALDSKRRMRKRHESSTTSTTSSTTSTSSSASTSTRTSTSTSTSMSTSTTSSLISAATSTAISLPTPFDSGFSNNITQSCSAFVNGFLGNATFQTCLPFSLLLQSSNSFFQITKSLVRTTELLDYTCSANVNTCTAYTAALAANISHAANCGSDLAKRNPLILQALLGLEAYQVEYQASCLRNPTTAAYCFADAVTNSSSPTDNYPYYLPLNISLPGGSNPTCDTCLQDTMAIFAAASSNRSSAIASTYSNAAQLINLNCGPGFVNATLPAAISSNALRLDTSNSALLALVVVVGSWLL